MKKLTESRLRNIIREELSKLSEASGAAAVDPAAEGAMPKEGQEIHQYLSNNGLSTGMGSYEYKGLHFGIDPMGHMVHVSVRRDKYDEETAASAKVEDGKVTVEQPATIKGGRPRRDRMSYNGPEQVVQALVQKATGGR